MESENIMTKANAVTLVSTIAPFIALLASREVKYKEGTSRQIVAPDDELKNIVSSACSEAGADYQHVISVIRGLTAGETVAQTQESMTTQEIEASLKANQERYSKLVDARKTYRDTKVMPNGFSLDDLLDMDSLQAEVIRLKKFLSRRKSETPKVEAA